MRHGDDRTAHIVILELIAIPVNICLRFSRGSDQLRFRHLARRETTWENSLFFFAKKYHAPLNFKCLAYGHWRATYAGSSRQLPLWHPDGHGVRSSRWWVLFADRIAQMIIGPPRRILKGRDVE